MYRKCNEICADACQSTVRLLKDMNDRVSQMVSPENLSAAPSEKERYFENMKMLFDANTIIREVQSEVNEIFTLAEIEAEKIIMESEDET